MNTRILLGACLMTLIACGTESDGLEFGEATESAARRGSIDVVLKDRTLDEILEVADERRERWSIRTRSRRQFEPDFQPESWRRKHLVWDAVDNDPRFDEEQIEDACAGCGADATCRLLCFAEGIEPVPVGAREIECLECGRETGFLGRPDLAVEVRENGEAWLSWDEVDGASQYGLHGYRWLEPTDGGTAHSHQETVWYTARSQLRVQLDADYTYAFYVVAWSADRKSRSLPSLPVRVEAQGEP